MKKGLFRFLIVIILAIWMVGCQKAKGDIENWDVKFWLVREVTINEYLQGKEPYKLTRKEAKKLVEAFNSVKEEDIYWDLSHGEALYGPFYGNVEIKLLTGKTISISYNPCGWIDYNEFHYFTNYQLEYYDVIRELQLKYGFRYENLEKAISNATDFGVAFYCGDDIVLNLSCLINDALRTVGREETYDSLITFGDLLEPYLDSLKLNDVVEVDNMLIKVIEIKDDSRITALAVHFMDEEK